MDLMVQTLIVAGCVAAVVIGWLTAPAVDRWMTRRVGPIARYVMALAVTIVPALVLLLWLKS